MDRDAAIYARPTSTPKQRADAKADYDKARTRHSTITPPGADSQPRKGVAQKLHDMAPWSDKLRETLDTITGAGEGRAAGLDTSQEQAGRHRRPGHGRETFIGAHGLLQRCSGRPARSRQATTTITATDDGAARQALFDLYGQQIIRPLSPTQRRRRTPDLLTELYNARARTRPARSTDRTTRRPSPSRPSSANFAAVSGLIDKTFGYVTATMPSLSSGLAGGRAATSALGGSAPATPIHPDVPAGRRDQPRSPLRTLGRLRRATSPSTSTPLTANPQQARRAADVIVGGIGFTRADDRPAARRRERGHGRPQAHHRHLPAVGRAPEQQPPTARTTGRTPARPQLAGVQHGGGSASSGTARRSSPIRAASQAHVGDGWRLLRATSDLIRIQPNQVRGPRRRLWQPRHGHRA